VLKDMADGRVFMGQQAIDAGLVDGVSTLDALIVQLNRDRASGSTRAGVARKPTTPTQGTHMPITREQLAAEAPELLSALLAEGAATGATAERERIQSVQAQLMPGHEALITGLMFDGKSSAGDAAQAIVAAERKSRADHAAANASDAPPALPLKPAATVEKPQAGLTRADLDAKAKAHMAANPGVDYVAAVKHIESTQGA
jgi:capsid assembly protease